MAESFGLSQLGQLINGKSIYATSGIVTGSPNNQKTFSVDLPDDISCVIGQFSVSGSSMTTGSCVFIPDGSNHGVSLHNNTSYASIGTKLMANYSRASVTVKIGPVYIAILAW